MQLKLKLIINTTTGRLRVHVWKKSVMASCRETEGRISYFYENCELIILLHALHAGIHLVEAPSMGLDTTMLVVWYQSAGAGGRSSVRHHTADHSTRLSTKPCWLTSG